jgi:hypothetical protein
MLLLFLQNLKLTMEQPPTTTEAIQRIFWDSQPVPKMGYYDIDKEQESGPISTQTLEDVPKEPFKLVDQFEWGVIDMQN